MSHRNAKEEDKKFRKRKRKQLHLDNSGSVEENFQLILSRPEKERRDNGHT